MNNACRNYCQEIYTSQGVVEEETMEAFSTSIDSPSLTEQQTVSLEDNVSLEEEINHAIQNMRLGKDLEIFLCQSCRWSIRMH